MKDICTKVIAGRATAIGQQEASNDRKAQEAKSLYTRLRNHTATNDERHELLAVSGMQSLSTPDILFTRPLLLFGKPVHWLEIKHVLVVPGISDDRTVNSLCNAIASDSTDCAQSDCLTDHILTVHV